MEVLKPWQPQGENGGGPGVRLNQLQWPLTVDPLGPMPSDQTERMDAALQRSLPEVQKLYRYERRAIAERDRALRKLSELVGWEGGLRQDARRLQNEPKTLLGD